MMYTLWMIVITVVGWHLVIRAAGVPANDSRANIILFVITAVAWAGHILGRRRGAITMKQAILTELPKALERRQQISRAERQSPPP